METLDAACAGHRKVADVKMKRASFAAGPMRAPVPFAVLCLIVGLIEQGHMMKAGGSCSLGLMLIGAEAGGNTLAPPSKAAGAKH